MRRSRRRCVVVISALSLAFYAAVPKVAYAESFNAKTTIIVAKVFGFLAHKPAPDSKVIIFPGAADLAVAKANMATLNVVEGTVADATTAFAVVVNTQEEARAVRSANPQSLIISGDLPCVDDGDCHVVIQSKPNVKIFINLAAIKASGIEFEANFKMLITAR